MLQPRSYQISSGSGLSRCSSAKLVLHRIPPLLRPVPLKILSQNSRWRCRRSVGPARLSGCCRNSRAPSSASRARELKMIERIGPKSSVCCQPGCHLCGEIDRFVFVLSTLREFLSRFKEPPANRFPLDLYRNLISRGSRSRCNLRRSAYCFCNSLKSVPAR